MNKKIFLTLLCCMSLCLSNAQELSQKAQTFKTNFLSFLREEGYVPTVENNGARIVFKYQGESYWVDLSGSMPVQVTMHINGFSNKEANALAILLACNEVNKDQFYVKAFVDDFGEDGSTNIAIEMPCHTAEEFRYVFSDCVSSLYAARTGIQESYNKNISELENPESESEKIHVDITNSKTIRSSDHKWKVVSIELKGNVCIVTKEVTPLSNNTKVWSTYDEFVENAETGEKYYLQSSTIGVGERNGAVLSSKKTRRFEETYSKVPSSISSINISSGDEYYVKNVRLR